MTAHEQVRQLYDAAPFRPFLINLADGRQIPVNQCEFMTFSPSGRTIIVCQTDDPPSIIDLLFVADLEAENGEATEGHRAWAPKLPAE